MKIRFRRGILSSIVLLLLLATTSIWAAGDWSARATASSLGESLMNQVSDNVSERVERQLRPATVATRSVKALLDSGVVSLEDPDELLDTLESKVTVLGVDRVYVGDDEGRFFMVASRPDAPPRRRVVAPIEGIQYWSWLDKEGNRHRELEPISFDPRDRGWYTEASSHGEIWTDVYRFQSDNQPGITAAVRLVAPRSGCSPCVVGADVTLAELSSFLSRLEVSENGLAFLLDAGGNLIAHPDEKLLLEGEGTLTRAGQVSDPLIREMAGSLEERASPNDSKNGLPAAATTSMTVEGRGGDGAWRLLALPLAGGSGLPEFTIGVAVPEADFLATLHRTRFYSALIALASILFGVLLAVAVSRGIARPILHLERSMSRVGSFDLDIEPSVPTVYIELQQMVDSFEKMVGGLQSFSRYVPKDLVQDLVATGRRAEMSAEERELSIYFSDIAGFTSLCETMDPRKLTSQLGDYFETVVAAIKENGGTIDKFIGDAVMALWNAPRFNPNHALGAAMGALEALDAITRLNARWEETGLPTFPTRIGISTATVVVGNVGSSHRLSYTALGDGVNLTARLEGANKHYGTSILASESLVSRLPSGVMVVQPVDVLIVKGKKKNVRAFEIIGKRGDVEPARLEAAEMYTEAFGLYLARDFAGAKALFEQVLQRLPGYRPAELLLERCVLLSKEPPDEDWDGSFSLSQK